MLRFAIPIIIALATSGCGVASKIPGVSFDRHVKVESTGHDDGTLFAGGITTVLMPIVTDVAEAVTCPQGTKEASRAFTYVAHHTNKPRVRGNTGTSSRSTITFGSGVKDRHTETTNNRDRRNRGKGRLNYEDDQGSFDPPESVYRVRAEFTC